MDVELLVVAGCPHEAPAVAVIEAALAGAGLHADVITTVIETEEQAQARAFTGSPTVLVDGRDLLADPDAAVGLACRMYRTTQGLNGVPAVAELVAAFRRAGGD